MIEEYIPEHARAAVRAFEEALVDTRTRLARLQQVELPEVVGPSAEEFRREAERPDAPQELKDVARAVAEKRATWDDVARGRFQGVPEITRMIENGASRFADLWERGQREDDLRAALDVTDAWQGEDGTDEDTDERTS
jgi:hypothetical protein